MSVDVKDRGIDADALPIEVTTVAVGYFVADGVHPRGGGIPLGRLTGYR